MKYFESTVPIRLAKVSIVIFALVFIIQRCEKPVRLVSVTTDSVTEVSFTSCKLQGTIVDLGEGSIEEHGFCYSESQEPVIENSNTMLGSIAEKGAFTGNLLGLSENTSYFVRAFAQNNIGVYYGEQLSFTTLINGLPTVTTTVINIFDATSAVVGGDITDEGENWVSDGGVYYGTSANPELTGTKLKISSGAGEYSATISDLTSETMYYVKAYATNSDGTSYGSEETFTTSVTGLKPTVTTNTVIDIITTSATVGGNVINDGGDAVSERGIYYSTTANAETTGTKLQIGSGTGTFSTSLVGLVSGTEYYIKAYAINSIGTSHGDELTFETDFGGSQISDIDGNIYNTVKIGDQWWMQENLKVTHYPDGTAIPLVESTLTWDVLDTLDKAYCYYDNSTSNRDIYGALYTWGAAMNDEESSNANPSGVQGVCPTGWHLPSDDEWKELEMYLGISSADIDNMGYRGTNEGSKLAGNSALWNDGVLEDDAAFGTSGFLALPSGYRNPSGNFGEMGSYIFLWSSTSYSGATSWRRGLFYEKSLVDREVSYKMDGFPVRCVKD